MHPCDPPRERGDCLHILPAPTQRTMKLVKDEQARLQTVKKLIDLLAGTRQAAPADSLRGAQSGQDAGVEMPLAALAKDGDTVSAGWLDSFLAGDLCVQAVQLEAPPETSAPFALEAVTAGSDVDLLLLFYRKDARAMVALADADAILRAGAGEGADDGRQCAAIKVEPSRVRRVAVAPTLAASLKAAACVAAAADHLGAMQALLDMTIDYVRTRQQFGRPLGAFQALQHRLVDMFIALEEARALTMAAAMVATAERTDSGRVSMAAWECARRAGTKIAEEAIQMHGGIGMTEECRVGAYVKRILRTEASASRI